MLDVRGLEARYGPVQVLFGIDLSVAEGELVALIGANGAGKTTLLRTLSGLVRATGGSVAFDGETITAASPERRVRRGITQVPEGRQVFTTISVESNLRLGAYVRGRDEAARDLARVYDLFPALAERRTSLAGELSGGQQQMLAIGRALMARPRLLLLDEPSMGLAPRIAAEILDIVLKLRDSGTTVLLVEQNAAAALEIADRAYVIENGRIAMQGTGAALLDDRQVMSAYLGLD
ncbi:MAG: ABC transporter ATP-binding protein [Alphaproteobacteria bacterium]|nr:ABC transporter ATP-binding protein [Alphaproteobacteria bacterium]